MKPGSFRRLLAAASLSLVGSVLVAGCAAEDVAEGEPAADTDQGDPGPDVLDDEETTASTSSALGGCYQCSNCVYYARCRQPKLPYGLTYYSQKVARINRYSARVGCVAVIKTSSVYGHVAYVNRVASDGTITIDEGNWPSGRCGVRSGTKSGLHITGFICP